MPRCIASIFVRKKPKIPSPPATPIGWGTSWSMNETYLKLYAAMRSKSRFSDLISKGKMPEGAGYNYSSIIYDRAAKNEGPFDPVNYVGQMTWVNPSKSHQVSWSEKDREYQVHHSTK